MGFVVDTTCMGGNAMDQNNPFGNPVTRASLENASLIIVSRHTTSGYYDANPALWNGLDTPLILCSGYLARISHWGWARCSSDDAAPMSSTLMTVETGSENHAFLQGVASPIHLFDWSAAPAGTCPKGVFLPICNFAGGAGVTIARYGDWTNMPVLADIPAQSVLANGNVTGGRRAYLGHWGYDVDLGAGQPAGWSDFLTDDYRAILLNMIKELMEIPAGDFNLDGCVELDDLADFTDQWVESRGGLEADLDGNGSVDFADFALFAENWVKQCQ
jgi:hypothetical protein